MVYFYIIELAVGVRASDLARQAAFTWVEEDAHGAGSEADADACGCATSNAQRRLMHAVICGVESGVQRAAGSIAG